MDAFLQMSWNPWAEPEPEEQSPQYDPFTELPLPKAKQAPPKPQQHEASDSDDEPSSSKTSESVERPAAIPGQLQWRNNESWPQPSYHTGWIHPYHVLQQKALHHQAMRQHALQQRALQQQELQQQVLQQQALQRQHELQQQVLQQNQQAQQSAAAEQPMQQRSATYGNRGNRGGQYRTWYSGLHKAMRDGITFEEYTRMHPKPR